MKKRILAFGCHPDDVEFMASGTLALLADQGHEIHLATMTGGEVGSPALRMDEIQAKRLKENEVSAQVIGAHYHYAGGCDLEVEYSSEYRKLTTRLIRSVDPDIVLTHAPMDYIVDHEETSKLVRNAAFIASVPLYHCGATARTNAKPPYLYYWNALDLCDIFGRPLPIHFGVDVNTKMETKKKMLACHVSQREWLAYINNWDAYLENMKSLTGKQGKLIGRNYGECFIQHRCSPHPQDNILKDLLGDLVVSL